MHAAYSSYRGGGEVGEQEAVRVLVEGTGEREGREEEDERQQARGELKSRSYGVF